MRAASAAVPAAHGAGMPHTGLERYERLEESVAQSQNTSVELTIRATNLMGLTTEGSVMVGDRAFEFYNARNPEDFVQIPWDQVDHVAAEVIGGRHIARFAIFTKANGHFTFSTRDNKATLRAVREHVGASKMVRSASFLAVVRAGIASIPRAVGGLFRKRG